MSLTLEDKVLLKILFEPEKAKSLLMNEEDDKAFPDYVPDWTNLLEQARREGVSGVLFYNIRKHGLTHLLPQDGYRSLSTLYYTNLKRNMHILGALREVLEIFQEANIQCIVLKGIALAEHVYSNIAMRGMSDVDILVKKEDLFQVDECLSSLEYTSRDSALEEALHNPEGYLASLEYQKNDESPLSLHVHWHTVNTSVPATSFVKQIDINRIWEKSVMTSVGDVRARILCPEDLIIYLCEHALRVGHSFDRLILICDIFFTIKAYENHIDWTFIIEESKRFNLSRFVYYSLSIVQHFTSLAIPNHCIAVLKPPDISRGEKFFLYLQLNNRRIRGSSYFVYLAMNRGLSDKIRFIIRTFFPPARILCQRKAARGSELKKPYYFIRVWEVFSHIFRSFFQNRVKITK
jgi:hypothetical protein